MAAPLSAGVRHTAVQSEGRFLPFGVELIIISSPVLSALLAAIGAAQVGVQALAGALGVSDAIRCALTHCELAGGVDR